MNKTFALVLILIIFTFLVALVSYKTTYALFSDTATSTNNVFTASSQFPTPTPVPSINDIVISEVQIDGGNGQDNDNDFVELYNPTSSPINLNGLRLVKRSGNSGNDDNVFAFTIAHIIPAHGFFLWAHQSGGQNPNLYASTIGADVFSTQTLAASNSIAIRLGPLDTGTIIDALSWDPGASSLKEGTQVATNPQENESLERKAYSTSTISSMTSGSDLTKGNSFDSNNNSSDFIIRPTSQPQNSSSSIEVP